jgi:predicted GNAT family acetyltransferase
VNPDRVTVDNNEPEGQFEVTMNGQTAFLQYRRAGRRIALIHTEVPPDLEGRGLASKLARSALEHARAEGLTVIPICPYVASFIRKHSEFQDLLTADGLRELLEK